MTSDNISKVVATVGEDELVDVLNVPFSKWEEFQQWSSTTADYRQRLIDHFIKYSPWVGWSDLASRLYHYEQPAAVEAARAFITQTPGKTFKVIIIPKLNFPLKHSCSLIQLHVCVHEPLNNTWNKSAFILTTWFSRLGTVKCYGSAFCRN